MKRLVFVIAIILMVIFLSLQELQHEAVAINVEVPVRVFKGNQCLLLTQPALYNYTCP